MKANEYKLMADCVEDGIEAGWHRAHKYGEPKPEQIREAIYDAVMLEIGEYFDFEPTIEAVKEDL